MKERKFKTFLFRKLYCKTQFLREIENILFVFERTRKTRQGSRFLTVFSFSQTSTQISLGKNCIETRKMFSFSSEIVLNLFALLLNYLITELYKTVV